MAVKLIIDSGCDLSAQQAEAMGMILVPMTVHFGNEEFRSGVDLSTEEFYHKLAQTQQLPTTSQPTPFDFETAFEQVVDAGDEVVALCVSSNLSGTYQSACIAAADMGERVHVVDTQSVTMGQRILAEYACILRDQGFSAREIAQKIEQKKADVVLYGAVDTLEYLIKGGRLSKAAGAVGTVLGIRPVLTIQDGVLVVAGKARGPKASLGMLKSFLEETGIDTTLPYIAGYTGNDPQVLNPLLDTCDPLLDGSTFPISHIGSTIGTHAGPGLVGIACFRKA